jgi:class 3 adenylate cyclase/tetratricopeptide (TPR) repeat protein
MAAPDTPTPEICECVGFADFVVDVAGHTLTGAGGRDVPVTRAEFALLLAFLRAPGRVLSRDHLLDAVAGRRSTPFDRGVDVLVSRLRRKIEPDPSSPRLILTVPGVGYRFAERPHTGLARPERMISTAEPQPRPTERRQVTVMLCGLGAPSGLSAQLDPEDLASLLPSYQALCTQVIGRFGGMVAESANHSVLGYFGYPEAAEDDAEQAVRAALAIIGAVPSLSGRFRARVGIATGLVVVGPPTNDRGTLPVGEAVELANQLLGLAVPDTVAISASCRRLTRGRFDYQPLVMAPDSSICSDGAFRVAGERSSKSRFEALHEGRLTPLVGRTEELELLLRRWRRALSGEGQIVTVSGEPGIGKSRLAAAMQDAIAASGEPCERLEWFCSPHHRDSALYPIIAQLERAANFLPADALDERRVKLEALLAADGPTPEELSPIVDLLGLPPSGCYPRLDLTPQLRREHTLRALLKRVEVLANVRPVLGVLEDAHWADPTTLELLDLLAARVDSLPMLVVVTHRPDFHAPWAGQAHVMELRISRLNRRDNAELVERVAGAPGTLVPEIIAAIVERTDGVPLFTEEVTRAALEAGGETVPQVGLPAVAGVPATLYASLTARLDWLGATAQQVAQAGAAIGREFGHDLLAAIVGLSDDAIGSALRQLEGAELIHRRGVPPEATYSLRHVLLRDAAYGMLLREPRRALHARIAEAMLRLRPDVAEREPHLLAWHYSGAGQAELAIGYWRRAAERSVAQFANHEAIGYFQRALDLLETLPPGRKRDRLEADLRLAQIVPLRLVHGFGSGVVEACAERAKALGDQLPDWPGVFTANKLVWNARLFRQPLTSAMALARDLLPLAERSGDPARILVACRALGYSLFITGKPADAYQVLARGLTLADDLGETEFAIYEEDPRIICRLYLGPVLSLLGYPEAGLRIAEEGLAMARARNNPQAIAWSLVVLARIHGSLDDAPGEERVAAEAIDIARHHRFPQWLAMGQQRRGCALCRLGDTTQGLALIEGGLRHLLTTGQMLTSTSAYCGLAEGCLLAGRSDAALGHVEAAHRHAETYGEHFMSAEIYRLHAEVLRVQGAAVSEIERHLHAAVDIARHQGVRLYELRAATGLARIWQVQGRGAEAHSLLAPLYASFTEGFDLRDLVEARALLSQTQPNPAPSS